MSVVAICMHYYFFTIYVHSCIYYTHMQKCIESVLEASKANDGKHLNCTFSFAMGLFLSLLQGFKTSGVCVTLFSPPLISNHRRAQGDSK